MVKIFFPLCVWREKKKNTGTTENDVRVRYVLGGGGGGGGGGGEVESNCPFLLRGLSILLMFVSFLKLI